MAPRAGKSAARESKAAGRRAAATPHGGMRLLLKTAVVGVAGVTVRFILISSGTPRSGGSSSSSSSVWGAFQPSLLEAGRSADLAALLHELHGNDVKVPPSTLFPAGMEVIKIAAEPRALYIRHLLSPKEVALTEKAFRSPSMQQLSRDNGQGDVFAPNPLVASGRKDAEKLDKLLDKRIAALAGVPERHVEMGYMTEKLPGFKVQQLHHDHGDQRREQPFRTLQSMVIYLNENPTALTTFPLAKPVGGQLDGDWERFVEEEALPELRREGFRHLRPSDGRPAVQRVLQRHEALCAHPERLVPGPGDAVWFFNYANDTEDLRSIHGTCSVPAGTKLSLSKFILGGPDPFKSQ